VKQQQTAFGQAPSERPESERVSIELPSPCSDNRQAFSELWIRCLRGGPAARRQPIL